MNQRKRVIIEQRNKTKFESQMKEFNTIIESDERGAMLFAVARGKLSEGIDFSDKSCRAVIIIGIPFAPHQDRRVIAKRHYLDEINRGKVCFIIIVSYFQKTIHSFCFQERCQSR